MTGRSGGAATVRPLAVARGRLLLAMLAALLGISGAIALPTGGAHAEDGDLLVELTQVAPTVLRTGDELTISGRVRNRTADELPAPSIRLDMQKHVPASTEALGAWLDGTSTLNVTTLSLISTEDPIPAGGSVPFTITIPTEGTFDQLSAWGPRGVAIVATTAGLTAEARTTLLWYPTDPPLDAPAELTLLVPLTPTAQEWSTATSRGVPVGQVAAPRLLAVLDAVGANASLAIDPALLEVTAPGQTSTTEDPPAPDAVQAELIARLAQVDTRRDLIALGYADADVTALTAAGGEDLWDDGATRARALFEDAGLAVENVAWPPAGVSTGGLDTVVGSGAEAVVLDADEVATAQTTLARATVDSSSGPVDALVADARLGAALVDTTLEGAAARQATLALSAVMTRAIPQDGGGFLVALPRDVGTTGLDELSDRIHALEQAPWLQPTNLRSLLGRTDGTGISLEIPDTVEDPDGVPTTTVRQLQADREVVDAYAIAAGDAILDSHMPLLLTPLSSTLDADAQLRDELVDSAAVAVEELGSSIRVEAGSSVLLITDAGSVPVTITNALPVPATVYVQLVPEETRLQAREIPQVVLAPNETTTERIPITAVANGNVTVDVHVMPTIDGPDLAPPASFAVRVRAEWENIGTAVVAGLLGVAFIIGLIRTIRRGGRRAAAQ